MDLTYHLTREDHWQCLKLARARVASRAKGPLRWVEWIQQRASSIAFKNWAGGK